MRTITGLITLSYPDIGLSRRVVNNTEIQPLCHRVSSKDSAFHLASDGTVLEVSSLVLLLDHLVLPHPLQ